MDNINTNAEGLDSTQRIATLGTKIRTSDVSSNGINVNPYSSEYIQESFDKIHEAINKIEGEKLNGINTELSYIRHVLDYQNTKIEKMTSILGDILENKNHNAIVSSLQAIQDNNTEHSNVDNEQVNEVQDQALNQVEQQVHEQVRQAAGMTNQDLASLAIHLDSNMDPELHHVAVAAVAVQAQVAQQAHEHQLQHSQTHQLTDKPRKRTYTKRRDPGNATDSPVNLDYSQALRSTKRPKIMVDFLHNPMTVKEIYDEFTKGFRGQIPLCEMDSKYGKHEWRGDSRSKESKRYQRRKKLCDAIARGMQKYDKPAEDIIRYIEEFRGDKSLTWVMNGNLPSDLMN